MEIITSRYKTLSQPLYRILQLSLLSNSHSIGEEGDIHEGDSEEGVGGEDVLYTVGADQHATYMSSPSSSVIQRLSTSPTLA